MDDQPADDFEELKSYTLDDDSEAALLAAQTELTFCWANRDGFPVGVIMSYVFRHGRFWVTASSQRKRIAAVRRDPRVSVVLTSRGSRLDNPGSKSLTYKGRCTVHDDEETKAWFYPALAHHLHPDDDGYAANFAKFLDSPRRVILEIVPEQRIGYDGNKMRDATVRSPAWQPD